MSAHTNPTKTERYTLRKDSQGSKQLRGGKEGKGWEAKKQTEEGIFPRMWWTQMKWEAHDIRAPVLLGRLSSQSFHITYSQSNVGKEVSHGKWQKDNKKLMKRPVPVNMLVKRVFLLSAESSWNSSSFIWNPGCKKKGPLHKLTTSRCRSKLSITLPNTPDVLHFNMNFK